MRAKKTKNYGKLGNKIGCLISNFAIDVMKAEKPCKGDMNDPLYIDKYNKAHAKCVWGVVEQVFKALAAVCITVAISSTCIAAGLPRYEIGDVGTNESQAAVIVGNRVTIEATGSKIISFYKNKVIGTGEVASIDKDGNLQLDGGITSSGTLAATTLNVTTLNATNAAIATLTATTETVTTSGIGNLNLTGTATLAAVNISSGTGVFSSVRSGTFEGTGGGSIDGRLSVGIIRGASYEASNGAAGSSEVIEGRTFTNGLLTSNIARETYFASKDADISSGSDISSATEILSYVVTQGGLYLVMTEAQGYCSGTGSLYYTYIHAGPSATGTSNPIISSQGKAWAAGYMSNNNSAICQLNAGDKITLSGSVYASTGTRYLVYANFPDIHSTNISVIRIK